MTIRIFISHAHDEHHRLYNSLVSRFDDRGVGFWQNDSVPRHALFGINNVELSEAELEKLLLERLMRCDVVVVIAKSIVSRRRWIKWELETAKKLGKPIVAVWRRRVDLRVSQFALRLADDACASWNIIGIVNAIERAINNANLRAAVADALVLASPADVIDDDQVIEPLASSEQMAPLGELALGDDEVVVNQSPQEALQVLANRIEESLKLGSAGAIPVSQILDELPEIGRPSTPPPRASLPQSMDSLPDRLAGRDKPFKRWWWPFGGSETHQ